MKSREYTTLHNNLFKHYVSYEEMFADGTLGLLLRLGRWAGVAPHRSSRLRYGFSYQAAGMTFLNMVFLTGVILDFCQEPENRLRIGTTFLKAVIWVSEIILIMSIASITVYTGPKQTQCLQRVLKQLQQIQRDLIASGPSARTEKMKSIVMVFLLTWISSIMILDVVYYYRQSLKHGTMYILYMHAPFYIANLLWVLAVLLWALTVELVHDAAAAVNERLQRLRLRIGYSMKPGTSFEEYLSKPRSISTLLNCFAGPEIEVKTTKYETENFTHPAQARTTIRRLALSHERIGDVMQQMNQTNGVLLMIMVTTTFLKLVITPYYMLMYLCDEDSNAVFDVFLPLNWSVATIVILILIIEPCHRTHGQREHTAVLLSKLIACMAPKCRQISKELDQFAKHVVLGNPKFAPLGIYTLDRPLMAMMLSGITTYLVIIIQFQYLSQKLYD